MRPAPGTRASTAHVVALLLAIAPTGGSARDPGPATSPPAPLPEGVAVELPFQSAPLRPTAEAIGEPPGVTPSLMEHPNGSPIDAWVDLPHAFLEQRMFAIVNGFDHFFADERVLDCTRAASFVRWRNEVRVEEGWNLAYGTNLRADLALPYLRQRLKDLRIVLENAARGLTETGPRAIDAQGTGGRGDALVKLTIFETITSSVDLGTGILLQLPPGLAARARYRQSLQLGPVALARFALIGFWNSKDGFGSNASLAFERSLGRRLLLRWTNGTLVSQSSSGYEAASELALLATLGPRTGLTLLGSATGHSKPVPVVQRWRVATRLRTAFFRRWIYGEVEPEVAWPVDELGGRRAVPAVIFRLELQFEDTPRKPGVAGARGCGLASKEEPPKGGA